MGRARALLAAVVALLAACSPAKPTYVASNPALRTAPLFFYPAAQPAHAWLFFFGNDVGFWDAHQRLAQRLAGIGIGVAGIDVRPVLRSLPNGTPEERARAFADTIGALVTASRHELHADTLPALLGGHSIGAELALYTAAHLSVPGLRGVLALSPGTRGHLTVSWSDITMTSEPTEPGSFAITDEICATPHGVRIAVIRGAHDHFRSADSSYAVAGGTRLKRWLVPLAGHSLKSLTIEWPMVERAVSFLLEPR